MKIISLITTSLILLNSCSGGVNQPGQSQSGAQASLQTPWNLRLEESGLPQDGVQPWESLDGNGHVIPADARASSSINAATDFTPGVERFLESGDVASNGEALRLNGTDDSGSSYAMYRVSLQGEQPGIVSIDANLLGSGSEYYVAVSNYGSSRWDWHGPFTDGRIRLPVVTDGSGDYTSTLGNTFVTVLVNSGSSLDIVGVGINQYDLSDAIAPATPSGLGLTPVNGGLELSWSPVLEADLAGYAIYYSNTSFVNPINAGVQTVPYLEGSTRHLLGGLQTATFVAVAAVDFAGNASALSSPESASPLAASPANISVTGSAASGPINDAITLSASGAEFYDWDLNGDGIFEVTDDNTGSQQADTSATGLIRPRVRGRDSSGERVALGGLSLLVSGNTRPVASATAAPQSGPSPLDVSFTGLAEDLEDDASALEFAWDFDGDGIYEAGTDSLTPAMQQYATPGIFGAKFRVMDTEGSWDVDTVPVQVNGEDFSVPLAQFSWNQAELYKLQNFHLDASASRGSLGEGITSYEWDLDGDGTYEIDNGTDPLLLTQFDNAGEFEVSLRVTDSALLQAEFTRTLTVLGWRVINLIEAGPVNFWYPSMQEVNGGLAFSYAKIETGANELRYAFNFDDVAKQSDWQHITVSSDESSLTGSFCTLAVIAGNPAISYKNQGDSGLRYTRSSSVDGSNALDWSSPVLLELGVQNPYIDNSLTEVAGNPALTYRKGSSLFYARSDTPEGTSISDWQELLIDNQLNGSYALSVVSGNPALAYQRADVVNQLLFIRSSSTTGSSIGDWNNDTSLPVGSSDGGYLRMATVNGLPALGFGVSTDTLGYAWSSNPFGGDSDEWYAVDVDLTPTSYNLCSMMMSRGRPALCYHIASTDQLYFVRSSDPYGAHESSWSDKQLIDPYGWTGPFASMLEYDGRVVIAYFALQGSTRYMRLAILYE